MGNRFERLVRKWQEEEAQLRADHKRDPEGSRRRHLALLEDNQRRERELRSKKRGR